MDEEDKRPKTVVDEDDMFDKRQIEKKKTAQALNDAESMAAEAKKGSIDTQEKFTFSPNFDTKGVRLKLQQSSSFFFVAIMLLVGIGAVMFFSPSILLVNIKEQLANDLNDSTAAHYIFSKKVLWNQIGKSCNEETIKCKFSTMSPMLKKSFTAYDFIVTANETPTKRLNVSSIIFPNLSGIAALHGLTLEIGMMRDEKIQTLVDKVYNPRTDFFQSRKFKQRLEDRFGIKNKMVLSGNTPKRVYESFDQAIAGSGDRIDENGHGVFGFTKLSTSAPDWVKIATGLAAKANSHLSLGCAYLTYAGLADNAVRQAKQTDLARFAMQYLTTADAIKANNVNKESDVIVGALADRLTSQNPPGFSATDWSSYKVPANLELFLPSPFLNMFMNNATEAVLPILVASIQAQLSPTTVKQGHGGEQNARGWCTGGMTTAQKDDSRQSRCYDTHTMPFIDAINPAASAAIRGGGIASQSAGSPVDVSRTTIESMCESSLKSLTEVVAGITAPVITAMVTGALTVVAMAERFVISSNLNGVAAADALFSGTGIILGDMAQSLGMRPADPLSLQLYRKTTQGVLSQIENEKKIAARETPFDIYNRYSFAGSIVNTLAGGIMKKQGFLDSIGTVVSAVPSSLAQIASPKANAILTQPSRFSPERMAGCFDPRPLTIGITPDFGCNIRYSMSPIELLMEIDPVLDYMTQSHSDESSENLSQIRERVAAADREVDQEVAATMLAQAEQGANAKFIDEKTGKPNRYTEYEKFRRYCVNREEPWGITNPLTGYVGMAVNGAEQDPPEDDKDPEDDYPVYGSNYEEEDNRPEIDVSYYSAGWGGDGDQDWYSGKKCLEESEMLRNFRVYTMICSILGHMSGSRECWHKDAKPFTRNDFYTSNNILFVSQH